MFPVAAPLRTPRRKTAFDSPRLSRLSFERRRDTLLRCLLECVADSDQARFAARHSCKRDTEGSGLRVETFGKRKQRRIRNHAERDGNARISRLRGERGARPARKNQRIAAL